jgi:uncharacterized protein (DUF2249 family)
MEPDIKIDVCGLEPPEPMVRVLDALSHLTLKQRLCVTIGCEPRPLYRILDNNGYAYDAKTRPDHLYEITIWQKA